MVNRSVEVRAQVPRNAEGKARNVSAFGYRVERGDTLYSIAFRNGLDYRDLAQWNGIGPPYTIYVGQALHLSPDRGKRSRMIAAAGSAATARRHAARQGSVSRPTPFQNVKTVPARVLEKPSHAPTAPRASTPAQAAPVAPVVESPPPVVAPDNANTEGGVTWAWPAVGPLVAKYVAGDPTHQGIDIAGKLGDPVRAAAAGTVVYSGNGLIGYGELIIIKHSPTFLSAYGHNSKRLVQEGEDIKLGQVIAKMGASNASRNALHFEIRKNGKPVDPLDYLPGR
ncbi:MAG: peptidoglycan DD-metalloendopeptidase family protein [Rhodanobacteraceae bacterium]